MAIHQRQGFLLWKIWHPARHVIILLTVLDMWWALVNWPCWHPCVVRELANDAWNCVKMTPLSMLHSFSWENLLATGKKVPSKAIRRKCRSHALAVVLLTWIPWLIALFPPDFVSTHAWGSCERLAAQGSILVSSWLCLSSLLFALNDWAAPEGKRPWFSKFSLHNISDWLAVPARGAGRKRFCCLVWLR